MAEVWSFYFFLTRSLFLPLLLSSSPLPSVPPSTLPITRRSMSRTTHFTAFKSRETGEQEKEPPGNYPARDESSNAPQVHPLNSCLPYPVLSLIYNFSLSSGSPPFPFCVAQFFSLIVCFCTTSCPAPVSQSWNSLNSFFIFKIVHIFLFVNYMAVFFSSDYFNTQNQHTCTTELHCWYVPIKCTRNHHLWHFGNSEGSPS